MPSSGGAPSALVGGRGGGRRTVGEDELLLSAVHEGMALQSPDLMPHVLIEVRLQMWWPRSQQKPGRWPPPGDQGFQTLLAAKDKDQQAC